MSKQALNHFKKHDPVLAKLVKNLGELPKSRKLCSRLEHLVEAIISQQLSVKASDTIYKRFLGLFPKSKFPKPEQIFKLKTQQLRAVGISNQKAIYIFDLAEKVVNKKINLRTLHTLSDEEVIQTLIQVKGIGRWTAEMFLMFSLQRPDIFSVGDLGLKNAIIRLYGLKQPLTEKQLHNLVKKWSPYKTIASRYLWKSLNNEPTK